jgi:protein-tyrosine phosphatase
VRPFTVLHVCMGNICRSPMAEHFLRTELGDAAAFVRSHGAGTGDWHVGEPMNPPAARQILARGGDPSAFRARVLQAELIDESDLILTATVEQSKAVRQLVPSAISRTFVLGEFARLAADVEPSALPPFELSVSAVAARGRALVEAVDRIRAGESPEFHDELDDPWGRGEAFFTTTADRVVALLCPLVDALVGTR